MLPEFQAKHAAKHAAKHRVEHPATGLGSQPACLRAELPWTSSRAVGGLMTRKEINQEDRP
jgi:hypothetical protein